VEIGRVTAAVHVAVDESVFHSLNVWVIGYRYILWLEPSCAVAITTQKSILVGGLEPLATSGWPQRVSYMSPVASCVYQVVPPLPSYKELTSKTPIELISTYAILTGCCSLKMVCAYHCSDGALVNFCYRLIASPHVYDDAFGANI
jgi:hypothetical protein